MTSFLENKGVPGIVERTLIRPPSSRLGPIEPALRAQLMVQSPVAGKYDKVVDRESAYEMLRARADAAAREAAAQEAAPVPEVAEEDGLNRARRWDGGMGERKAAPKREGTTSRSDSIGTSFAKSFARQLGSKTGQAVVRGILGSLFRSR